LKKYLFTEENKLQRFLKIYLGDTDIAALQNEETPVGGEDIISIIPVIAGGEN